MSFIIENLVCVEVIDSGSGTHTRSYGEVITPYNIEGSVKVMLNLIQIICTQREPRNLVLDKERSKSL